MVYLSAFPYQSSKRFGDICRSMTKCIFKSVYSQFCQQVGLVLELWQWHLVDRERRSIGRLISFQNIRVNRRRARKIRFLFQWSAIKRFYHFYSMLQYQLPENYISKRKKEKKTKEISYKRIFLCHLYLWKFIFLIEAIHSISTNFEPSLTKSVHPWEMNQSLSSRLRFMTYQNLWDIHIYQPLRSDRIWHKVNS